MLTECVQKLAGHRAIARLHPLQRGLRAMGKTVSSGRVDRLKSKWPERMASPPSSGTSALRLACLSAASAREAPTIG